MLSNHRGIEMDACIHRQYLDRLLLELTRAENRTKSTQTVELKLTSTRGSRDMGPTSTSWRAFSPPRSEEVAVGRCAAVSDAARHRGCSINGRRRLPLLAAQHLSGAAPEGVRHDAIQQGVEGGIEEQHYLSERKDEKNMIKHVEVYTPDNQKLLPGRSQTRLIARMWCGRTDSANTSRTAMSRRTTFLRIVSTLCDVTRKRKEVLAELPRLSTYTPSPEAEVGSMAAAADPDDEEGWVKVEVATLLIVAAPGCAGSRGVARLPEIVQADDELQLVRL
ncbi:hypothetical protein C0Q70_16082 [Pomacea canaliculata]|uniref:Uncharacterized protein n=1 Tax=Pomacea canaliculata TaxID=400727 RepID=A0A2T7NNV1_POMCA|nr:hypothetical protein C0Q70_16082 [Pomacea canaliculata]